MATIEEVHREIDYKMQELEKYFTKDCRLTFVMRHISKPGCYMVVTQDDPKEVAATVLKQI